MQLSLQSFTTLVRSMAAATQAASATLLNLTAGSVLRAILEANASVALWLEWLILQTLSMTRAATSLGGDLDTWVADFSLTRLPAAAATGSVTFSRFTTGQAALIPAGATVKTADGTQSFTVTIDTTNGAWSPSQSGYAVGSAVASVTVPVQAANAGTQGNVLAATITLLSASIPGIDTVTNASAFTNGIDAETDAALRARFANYIQTRSRGTPAAIAVAIAGVQQGLNWTIQENVLANGTAQMGNFVVTVDDGSGAPPSTLLTNISLAIAAYRPVGSTWTVQGPTDTTATISLTIATVPTANKPLLLAPVQAAIVAYVNALPIGALLAYSRIAAVAYAVDPTITDVTAALLNGGTADITPNQSGAVKTATGNVTVS